MVSSEQPFSGLPASTLPLLSAEHWHSPLTPGLLLEIAALLPDFLISRRWFRAKARTVTSVVIKDVIPFAEHDSWLLVLSISYAEGDADNYLLPVSLTSSDDQGRSLPEGSEVFAELHARTGQKGVLHSAFANPRFRTLILNAIANGQSFSGVSGMFAAAKTAVPSNVQANFNIPLESFVSRAEQSNTSIIFGDQFILKLFRKVEAGINPDIEVGKFLTEHNFVNTPAVLGTLEYRSTEENATYSAGILQKFVRNQGDAWKYTLDSLAAFFQRVLADGAPLHAPTLHPLELMKQPLPAEMAALLGPYAESAALLGKRTAEMHLALASDAEDPEFAPEPLTAADTRKLHGEMLAQSNIAFDVLRLKASTLTGTAAESASQLLQLESAVHDRFSLLRQATVAAHRIRFHGDYHLGQVLFTGQDFMIIDFEGEPARPLSERRDKTICLRDVAGMVRSFQYAGYASLFGQVAGLPLGNSQQIEAYAALWNAWVTAIYLKSYFDTAGNAPFLPHTDEDRRTMLDAFLLHKALYEVAYELNNRPDWVTIPLRGILSLL